jgi:hypothetical protein
MSKENINFFAETNFRQNKKKFGIKIDDRRRHFYVIGKTGMGKTAMIRNMAIQDITNGNGIAFMDPHGETAEELLNCIPKERIKDVVYFNPCDLNYPIAFNIMEAADPDTRHLIAAGLMGVFKKIWPDVWSARMEYILHNSILALLEYPGSTLLGINRMLSEVDYRKEVVDKITDPMVKLFWTKEFARYTQRYEVEATAAIQNKVGQFISNPLVRNIIGQTKSSIDMRTIMDEKKILILNLSKGRIGEDSSALLGALAITKIYLAAMSRIDTPEEERKDFFLYVDEFQNFATESFASILSESRKYRLCLTLAHQYIAQMEDIVRDAVFGNVGTTVSFRIGAEDAEFLEKEFSPIFIAEDLVNLSKYNIYLKLLIDGVASNPFSAQTLPPLPELEQSFKKEIVESSREKYGTPRKEIESKIIEWSKTGDAPQKKKSQTSSRTWRRESSTNTNSNRSPAKTSVRVVTPPQIQPASANPAISLKEATEKDPVPFAIPRKKKDNKDRNKKRVDTDALKEVIDDALVKKETNNGNYNQEKSKKERGFLKPGQKVRFD